jgi:hypothetical protein
MKYTALIIFDRVALICFTVKEYLDLISELSCRGIHYDVLIKD